MHTCLSMHPSVEGVPRERRAIQRSRVEAANTPAADVELVLRVAIANGKITRGIDHFHQEHVWDAFWE